MIRPSAGFGLTFHLLLVTIHIDTEGDTDTDPEGKPVSAGRAGLKILRVSLSQKSMLLSDLEFRIWDFPDEVGM